MPPARPARPWSLLLVPATLALLVPACGGGAKKTEVVAPASTVAVTCGDAATVLGPLGAAQLGKDGPDADAVRAAVEEVVRAECEAGPWAPEVLSCLGDATAETINRCHGLLPRDQADHFEAALEARMKVLLGDAPKAPPPPGGGAGDDAEGGAGLGAGGGASSTGGGDKVERKTRGRKVIKKSTDGAGADPDDGGEADPDDGGEADPDDGGEADPDDGGEADGGFFRR